MATKTKRLGESPTRTEYIQSKIIFQWELTEATWVFVVMVLNGARPCQSEEYDTQQHSIVTPISSCIDASADAPIKLDNVELDIVELRSAGDYHFVFTLPARTKTAK